ncbi:polysaccharide pyruvyl transferase family protein [Porphyromonas levii]|uniref:polysaccharide pyruvyl transferase family protein n=1 Tax=Porphyromonas levii TaxID=28114 RepID=UPI001B8AA63F|nr:polysaccharide pyruvyl transferase family protein [Porphyromonas levii]MBR8712930.1 hypothetical protein [Porphyromonas levii]MBR8714978.1 hypothetical protein [Porphyromonas levii]MBR8727483.1 hypothetical protein [Porphyromonas levii]MBR8735797.1 hypothetical protein [Porphyromonas levii]MBR8773674.1 hypothetical protein [Porphyromonas levii]
MAKIGILTQPLGLNYGGILQAFALQHVLRKEGHSPIILNRVRSPYVRIASLGWNALNFLLGKRPKLRILPNHKELGTITQYTTKFIDEHISITDEIRSTNQLKHIFYRENFNTVIVGSDQVWRKRYSPSISNYFLDLLSGNDEIKKVAYAASFGIDYWEYGKKETEYFKALAQEFDAISVREDSAVKLCKKYLGIDATHVLDPTMLVDKSVYEALAKSPITEHSKGNLFCYVLDRSPEKMALVKKVAKDTSLTPFELLPKKKYSEIKSAKELDDCTLPPVEQWLRSFVEAEFVITDSFHGTVFSIIFNKPFIVIPNLKRGASRFTSLLGEFALMDHLIDLDSSTQQKYSPSDFDWSTINEQLRIDLQKSFNFIMNNVE